MSTWYSYDPEQGVHLHRTADEAEQASHADMAHCRPDEGDCWHENIAALSWGEMVCHGEAVCVERRPAPDGSPYDEWQEWSLVRLPGETAKIDALFAALGLERPKNIDPMDALKSDIARLRDVERRWRKACEIARAHCPVGDGESHIYQGIPRLAAKLAALTAQITRKEDP